MGSTGWTWRTVGLALGLAAPAWAADPAAPAVPAVPAPAVVPAVPAPPTGCYPATFSLPCGASGWTVALPDGPVTVLARGPGAPQRGLDEDVLLAPGNRWLLCGAVVETVDDAACGPMPVFEATAFRLDGPVQRLACTGLLSDCAGEDGVVPTRPGPARLVRSDLEDCPGCRLRCAGDDCTIDVPQP